MDAKLVEQAKAMLAEMKQAAENLTDALGLPREATYDVLAMIYGEEPSPFGMPQAAVQPEISEDTLKNRIFQLSQGFLSAQMNEQVVIFRTLWERLKTLPLETLGKGLEQRPAASKGLGFTGSQQLLPVVSVISWAVVNQATLQTNTPQQMQVMIMREAENRGCSRALSSALALYLQPRLINS